MFGWFKKKRLALVAIFAGAIAGPPALIIADGLRSQFYGSPSNSTQRLFDEIQDARPAENLVLWGYPAWLDEAAAKCAYPISTSDQEIIAPRPADSALTFEAAWDALYSRDAELIQVQAISDLTTPFGRTALSDCLSMPLLSYACRGYAFDLVERAKNISKPKRKAMAKHLTDQLAPLRCASLGGNQRER
jgi:hypothetical protein